MLAEFQITQEYLGFSNHLVWLATLWKECLESDTRQAGKGSTVARVTDGTVYPHKLTAVAGVANIGEDANWCGHHYGPEPWCDIPGARPDWLPGYYHKADTGGIGLDRSSKGSNAVEQYHSPASPSRTI